MLVLFALGLGSLAGLATLPHCVAMCGAYAAFACTSARAETARAPTTLFLGARVATYTLLGMLAGASGSALASLLPPRATSVVLALSLAFGMLSLAWRLVRAGSDRSAASGLVPLRRSRGSETDRPRTRLWRAFRRDGLAPMLGATMALFPCGALYAALLIAAGTSSAWRGGAALFGFAVVSAVGLGASAAISRAAARVDSHTRRALGAALALGAIILVLRPLTSSETTHAAATCHHESVGP